MKGDASFLGRARLLPSRRIQQPFSLFGSAGVSPSQTTRLLPSRRIQRLSLPANRGVVDGIPPLPRREFIVFCSQLEAGDRRMHGLGIQEQIWELCPESIGRCSRPGCVWPLAHLGVGCATHSFEPCPLQKGS